jgi:hypothetical protein
MTEPGKGPNAHPRINVEIEWIDGKRTESLMQADSVAHADMNRMNFETVKVGFTEDRPVTAFGIPIPIWLDIQSKNIVAVREIVF